MIVNETGYMIVNELAPTRGGQVVIRSTSGPPEPPTPTRRGRSLTPRQAYDDGTTTTHLRPTGLHAGPLGRAIAGRLRDHQLRDMA
jgi:hypothetical protein